MGSVLFALALAATVFGSYKFARHRRMQKTEAAWSDIVRELGQIMGRDSKYHGYSLESISDGFVVFNRGAETLRIRQRALADIFVHHEKSKRKWHYEQALASAEREERSADT